MRFSVPRTALVLFLSTSLAAGCGVLTGDGGSTNEGSAGEPREAAPPPEEQVVPVGQTFWHSGFQVEIIDATVSTVEDAFGEQLSTLTLGARFTNLGEIEAYFGSEVAVVAGGASYPVGFESEVPNVPSGLTTEGTLSFPIEQGFELATAYLAVGSAGENQAQVPLGPQGGELVDLAPREVPLTGELTMELVDFTFSSGELRADLLDSYLEVEQGSLALTMNFTLTSRNSGNWSLHGPDFALILPEGTAVAPDLANLGSFSGNESGVATEGLWLRFLIHDPPEGDYTLRFTAPSYWLGEDSNATEGTFEFSL
jgi:hypothetical protein